MIAVSRSAPAVADGGPCRRVCALTRPSSLRRSAGRRALPEAAVVPVARCAQRVLPSALPRQQSSLLPPPPPLPYRRRQLALRRSRRAPARPQAGLYSLPPDLLGSLQTGCGIAYLLAIGFSALPILTGESQERNERRFTTPSDDDSTENIRWSVMGVLSVLPFVNPMAWVFAALDDDDASTLYYTLAFIYALPYVANGFELDGFALVSLLLCILHVQLERVAQTEPVEVELPSVLRRLLGGIPKAVRSLGRYSARLGDEVGERSRSAEGARKRRPDRKYLEERSREARAELEQFDRRRRERQALLQRQEQQQEREREKEKER